RVAAMYLDHGRERIVHGVDVQLARTAEGGARGLLTAAMREYDAQHAVAERVGRIEHDGAAVVGFRRRPVPVDEQLHIAEGGLYLGELGIGGLGAPCRGVRALGGLERRCITVDGGGGVRVRQPRPGERVARIALGGARVVLERASRGGRRQLVPIVTAAQVQVVGLRVARLAPRQAV